MAAGETSSFLPRGRPAVTMLVVVAGSISAVAYSHYAQVRDKAVMRAGVERDKERLRRIRKEQQQQKLNPNDEPSSR